MLRRFAATAFLMLALTALNPAGALAWGNGPQGGDGFGTHDWILTRASECATSWGYGWLDVQVAASATAEPDRIPGDQVNHNYDRWGHAYGHADTRVQALYNQAVALYRAGDRRGASRAVGLMSHYYADACDPLHTDDAKAESKVHKYYEYTVDANLNSPNARRSWTTLGSYNHVSSAAALTVASARTTHKSYAGLVKYYSKKHFTGTISTTRSSTKRAVDGLADMIASVRQDAIEGTPSPDVASHQGIAVGPDYYYVIHTTSIDRYTHSWVATGTNEDPMEGLDLEQAHLGDGCYYQGKLYIPAENWPTVSDQHILVYDAGTLERLKSIPTNKTHEVSSITVAQIDGADRLVISSYLDSSRLFLYELDGTFYRELPLTPMVPYGIQGVAYRDGRLYIASGRLYGVGNLWTATLEGSATPLYTRIQPGTHEGLEFDGDTLLWLVDQKTAGSRFTTLRFPSFMLPTP